jgi:hypothetical protein
LPFNGPPATGNRTAGNDTDPDDQSGDARRARDNGTRYASFTGTGAALPGERNVTLNRTGHYTAVFTVHWDNKTRVRVAAVEAEPLPAGSVLGNETRTFEGSFAVSEPLLCFGSETFEWDLNATFGGAPAHADHVHANVTADGVSDITLTLVSPNGTELASGPELDVNGTNGTGFEPGTYGLRVDSCFSADTTYTVTAVARYVSE